MIVIEKKKIEKMKIKKTKDILLKYFNGLEVPKELNIKVIGEIEDANPETK